MGKKATGVSSRQIAEVLRDAIRAGAYAKEGSFPSLSQIMARFGVSRPSAVKSIAELKKLGLVATRQGSGTFVLRNNRTIGLAIPGTADSEFFAAIMDGLVFNCNKFGMDLVAGDVFSVDHDRRDRQAEMLARHFASIPVAGVIMQPVGFSENADRINGVISEMSMDEDKKHTYFDNSQLTVRSGATLQINDGKKILGTTGRIALESGATLELVSDGTADFAERIESALKLPTEGAATIRIDGARLSSGDHTILSNVTAGATANVNLDMTSAALEGRRATLKVEGANLVLNIETLGLMFIVK